MKKAPRLTAPSACSTRSRPMAKSSIIASSANRQRSARRRYDQERPARQPERGHDDGRQTRPCRLPARARNPVTPLIETLAALKARKLDDGAPGFDPSNLEVTSVDVGNAAHNVIPQRAPAPSSISASTPTIPRTRCSRGSRKRRTRRRSAPAPNTHSRDQLAEPCRSTPIPAHSPICWRSRARNLRHRARAGDDRRHLRCALYSALLPRWPNSACATRPRTWSTNIAPSKTCARLARCYEAVLKQLLRA